MNVPPVPSNSSSIIGDEKSGAVYVRVYVRPVDYDAVAQPHVSDGSPAAAAGCAYEHPLWVHPFAIVEVNEFDVAEDVALRAVAQWRKAVLSTIDIYCCDGDGVVACDRKLVPSQPLLLQCQGYPIAFPLSLAVLSRPSAFTPKSVIAASIVAINIFALRQSKRTQRQERKEAALAAIALQSKRQENVARIAASQQQLESQQALLSHRKQEAFHDSRFGTA